MCETFRCEDLADRLFAHLSSSIQRAQAMREAGVTVIAGGESVASLDEDFVVDDSSDEG